EPVVDAEQAVGAADAIGERPFKMPALAAAKIDRQARCKGQGKELETEDRQDAEVARRPGRQRVQLPFRHECPIAPGEEGIVSANRGCYRPRCPKETPPTHLAASPYFSKLPRGLHYYFIEGYSQSSSVFQIESRRI